MGFGAEGRGWTYMLCEELSGAEMATTQKSIRGGGTFPLVDCVYHVPLLLGFSR